MAQTRTDYLRQRTLMLQYEQSPVKRPEFRLRVWKNEAGAELSGVETSGTLASGEAYSQIDLQRHYWVKRVRCTFDVMPGKYRLEYFADPEWKLAPVGVIPESEWLILGVGNAESAPALRGDWKRSTTAVEAKDYHEQEAIFLRYLRVVCEESGAVVTGWVVEEDVAIDVSGRVEGTLQLGRRTDTKFTGRAERATLNFVLANYDGKLDVYGSSDLHDESGETWLKGLSRWTYEIRYRGPGLEVPEGFEGGGWWPVYTGYLRRRGVRKEPGGSTVEVSLRAGRKALDAVTTQPLWEQMNPLEFVKRHLTMSDDGARRLMGAVSYLKVPTGTASGEYVGRVRMFEETWYDPILELDANSERIHCVATDGIYLYRIVERGLSGTRRILFEGYDNVHAEVPDVEWWLVQSDYAGGEIGSWKIQDKFDADYPGTNIRDFHILDAEVMGRKLYLSVLETSSSSNRPGLREYDLDNFHADVFSEWLPVYANQYDGDQRIGGIAKTSVENVLAICQGVALTGLPDGTLTRGWLVKLIDVTTREQVGVFPYNAVESEIYRAFDGGVPRVATIFASGSDKNTLIVAGELEHTVTARAIIEQLHVTALRIFKIEGLESDPGNVYVGELDPRSSSWPYTTFFAQGNYILAAGYGPDNVQEIAKVARMGYTLENANLRSFLAGDRKVNYGEPEIRLDDELRVSGSDYSLDLGAGRLQWLGLPAHGSTIRASYDYDRRFGLVPIKDQKRWDIVQEMALGFWLEVWVDEFDRLAIQPREFEELVLAEYLKDDLEITYGGGHSWFVGNSVEEGGLSNVVLDSVVVMRASDYEVVSESSYLLVVSGGKTELRMGGSYNIVVRFSVQETVPEIDRGELEASGETDVDRIVTKARVTGRRRLPSEFSQRIDQTFAIASAQAELRTSFERLQSVESLRTYNFRPEEKIYEQSEDSEKPVVHVAFNEPLLVGHSEFAVICARYPWLKGGQALFSPDPMVRFKKVSFATAAPDVNYIVLVESTGSFRLATAEDYEDMIGHCDVEGEPADADDVRTTGHFYLKKMNSLFPSTLYAATYSEHRYFRLDSSGRFVESAWGGEEEYYRSSWPGNRVRIELTPMNDQESPLFIDRISEEAGTLSYDYLTVMIDGALLLTDGLRVDLRNFSGKQKFLRVRVIGNPVLEAETFIGQHRDAAGIATYGEQLESLENEYLVNLKDAERMARLLVAERAEEPSQYTSERPFMGLLMERQLVRANTSLVSSRLLKVKSVDSILSREGSKSSVTFGR